MKRNITVIMAILNTLVLMTACSDSFLDEEVLDKYASETLNDELGFEASAVGLFERSAYVYASSQDQSYFGFWVYGTDEVWAPTGRFGGNASHYIDYAGLTSTDYYAHKTWTLMYEIINNANIMIQSAEGGNTVGLTEEQLNYYSAEARFFRAYAYNILGTLYGGVPLTTTPISEPKTDYVRASIDDINSLIVDDLTFATEYLPTVDELATDKKGRTHKAMANQLLAVVYLRINQPALAEAQCDAIINSGSFSLIKERFGVKSSEPGDAFSDMFYYGNQRRNQGNTETIWTIEQENPTDVTNGGFGNPQNRRIWGAAYHDLPGMEPCDSMGGRGLTRVRLNNLVLYDLYGENDMRNSKHSIYRQYYFNNTDEKYDEIRGLPIPYGVDSEFIIKAGTEDEETISVFAADTIYKYVPYSLKWGQFDSRDVFGYGMRKDFIAMRLGETFLLRAEARLNQGDLAGAADDINQLRERANADLVSASDIDLNFILDERARELIAEELRRLTLVRTGTLVERATTLSGSAPLANGAIHTTSNLQPHNMLLPIPQDEINLNKDAVLEQNPGY